jgi:hypothetical protein
MNMNALRCLPLLLAGTLLPAQGFRDRPRRMDRPALRPEPRPDLRSGQLAKAAPLLLQVRTQRIQDSLGLPESRAQAIAERWGRFDRDMLQKGSEMGALRNRCNDILMGPGTEDDKNARLRPILDQFMDLRRQQVDLKTRFEEDIRASLSPAQQVRLLLLVDELNQRLREGIRDALRER